MSEEIGAIFGNTGFEKGLMNDGEDDFEVGASGDFGDNTAVSGKLLEYAGELYSEKYGRKFTTEKAGFQVLKDTTDGTRLVLAIDRKPIAEWFK